MSRKPRTDTDESDEDLCRRCGQCCYAKVIIDDEVYYTDIPCERLDTKTNLCKVYDRRFELEGDCLTVEEGIRLGVFPADCPYVAGVKGYHPPKTDCNRKAMGEIYREEE